MSENELETNHATDKADNPDADNADVEGFMDFNPLPKPTTPVLKPTTTPGNGNGSGTVKPIDGIQGPEPFNPKPRPS